ncbi:MAG: hypothetical protein UW40_C0005G0023 [Parcubacteria group bacterium GW2011_GWF2_44_17]|nr:MAG: hypothetical protein UW40_C0005G0023 [Parcubacteria group bacterium GW2011_GWF2_44_17]
MTGFEPVAYPLRGDCSTTELHRQDIFYDKLSHFNEYFFNNFAEYYHTRGATASSR